MPAEAVLLLKDRLKTPLGLLLVFATATGRLRGIDWEEHEVRLLGQLQRRARGRLEIRPARNPGGATAALRAYFGGELGAINGLKVEMPGTPFQRRVWQELRRIPAGTTISYAELARRIGRPSSVRAVGLANGSNPVSIVVPCHRVIGSDGSLTGYGGGLPRKRWLLAHEGALSPASSGRGR